MPLAGLHTRVYARTPAVRTHTHKHRDTLLLDDYGFAKGCFVQKGSTTHLMVTTLLLSAKNEHV